MPKPKTTHEIDLWDLGARVVTLATYRLRPWEVAETILPAVRKACKRLDMPAPTFVELISAVRRYLAENRACVAAAVAAMAQQQSKRDPDLEDILRELE